MKTPQTIGQPWKLRFGLLCAGLGKNNEAALVEPDKALLFDARDNQELKRKFWTAILNVPFVIESL